MIQPSAEPPLHSLCSTRPHQSQLLPGNANYIGNCLKGAPARRMLDSRMRSRPSLVFGPVDRPPCIRQRPLRGWPVHESTTAGALQVPPALVLAPQSILILMPAFNSHAVASSSNIGKKNSRFERILAIQNRLPPKQAESSGASDYDGHSPYQGGEGTQTEFPTVGGLK